MMSVGLALSAKGVMCHRDGRLRHSLGASHDRRRNDANQRCLIMSGYDAIAPSFEHQRALPAGAAEAIREAVLASLGAASRPRLLDLGAGTGRIGWPFVAASDDYIGVDLSLGMLRAFRQRIDRECTACLIQADGGALPFPDAAFDAVLLVQVFGGARGWRPILVEARRVLRAAGALVVGRTVAPSDGIDARMRQRLASIVDAMGVPPYRTRSGDEARNQLAAAAQSVESVVAAQWQAERTVRGFVERHRTGVRFAALPEPIRTAAMRQLSDWATATFGSLDAPFTEPYAFELQIFRFQQEVRH
jgi:ubiquinone/menaquinone biosynthesis C-methylase UbiE